ncbi:ornithine carbamoyltransferase [Aquisalimonas asiatica]|uniref:Ornithine carbamoyltransferase n=1 Tax=Aquisalimonas asiatica TaxID=406100 RepID=A0A1H8SSN1_9GAMM|nr:ornithine carbamoyltransferase [Aquisalimonas asiatica]SEO81506.1 ornithine carbamoyltransferase [Aquisalimonas asiatica]
MTAGHFLTLRDFTPDALHQLIHRARDLKALRERGELHEPLRGKVLGMVFEKSSTRTRVSFEAGMNQLGGSAIFLSPRDSQLGRGEPVEDTARVLSRMVDAVMIRTFAHDTLERFAAYSAVPVINGLSDSFHPCQLLADIQTFVEHRGSIQGRTVAWIGDGNNMCHSYINAAALFDFQLRVGCPEGFDPDPDIVATAPERVSIHRDPAEAVAGADLVVTDVWASMGQEEEQKRRERAFAPYRVTAALMAAAAEDALFMHCLPAHRGEEVDADVIDGRQSVVWDEAENRLHAQKALLEQLMLKE